MSELANSLLSLREKVLESGLIKFNGFKAPRSDAKKYDYIKEVVNKSDTLKNFNSLEEKLFALFNNINEIPLCKTCNTLLKFNKQYKKFPVFCSPKCAQSDIEVRNKTRTTCVNNNSYANRFITTKKTCLKKYGVEFAAQSAGVKLQIKKTMQERYGINSALDVGVFRVNFENENLKHFGHKNQNTYGSDQFKNLMVTKHGKDNFNKTLPGKLSLSITSKLDYSEKYETRINEIYKIEKVNPLFSKLDYTGITTTYKWVHASCGKEFESDLDDGKIPLCPYCWGARSKVEAIVRKWLGENNINAIFSDRKIIKPFELDIVVEELKIAIEINGAYWHHSERSHLTLLEKSNLAAAAGYRLIHIWDYEILRYPDKIKSIILAACGKFTDIIYSRKCTVKKLSWNEIKDFLNTNHLQGAGIPTPINVGLIFNNEIVSVMSFGSSRFSANADFELYRFCNKLNTCVIGASKKIFKNSLINGTIISYCDKRVFSGKMYSALGFHFEKTSKPGYVWYSKKTILNRASTQKHKLKKLLGDNFNEMLSEDKNMKNSGYLKLIDCGQTSYIFKG